MRGLSFPYNYRGLYLKGWSLMNRSALALWLLVALASVASAVEAARADGPAPPVAERRPFEVLSPNGNRRDDY